MENEPITYDPDSYIASARRISVLLVLLPVVAFILAVSAYQESKLYELCWKDYARIAYFEDQLGRSRYYRGLDLKKDFFPRHGILSVNGITPDDFRVEYFPNGRIRVSRNTDTWMSEFQLQPMTDRWYLSIEEPLLYQKYWTNKHNEFEEMTALEKYEKYDAAIRMEKKLAQTRLRFAMDKLGIKVGEEIDMASAFVLIDNHQGSETASVPIVNLEVGRHWSVGFLVVITFILMVLLENQLNVVGEVEITKRGQPWLILDGRDEVGVFMAYFWLISITVIGPIVLFASFGYVFQEYINYSIRRSAISSVVLFFLVWPMLVSLLLSFRIFVKVLEIRKSISDVFGKDWIVERLEWLK